ncbi:hypothetical protein ccbrp13_14210 [Ktedonobacteria bacterium brp13]|nr:hypothetical protein ccbrp13_14210 [Ktedonobacteria bacterium brp13]
MCSGQKQNKGEFPSWSHDPEAESREERETEQKKRLVRNRSLKRRFKLDDPAKTDNRLELERDDGNGIHLHKKIRVCQR